METVRSFFQPQSVDPTSSAGFVTQPQLATAIAPFQSASQVSSAISAGTAGLQSASQVSAAIAAATGTFQSAAQVAAAVQAGSAFLAGFTPQSPGTIFGASGLFATNPASSSVVGRLAVVTDLWGSVNEVMRCGFSNGVYYWRPQRTDYGATTTSTGGSMTLTPLVTAPTLFMTGTLLSNLTITPSTANVWQGARFEIANGTSLGLFGITIGGLIGGLTKTLLAAGRQTLVYEGAAWQPF
jgi:hypothetical protein